MLLALIRFVIASLLLLPLAQSRGGLALLPRPLPLGRLVLMGLTGVTLFFAGSNLGLVYTSAADAALIQGAIPVVTTVLAVLVLRERVDRWRIGGIGVAMFGVGLIVLTGQPTAAAPNPFLRGTRLIFDLTRAADVRLAVFDALGREVAVLHDGPRPAGRHEAGLAGTDLAPGVYVVRLTTPDGVAATTVTRLP